ncbi:nicotinamidase, putative [Plasmodium knowlesi strain H]|uniref:nicotinamidase n=3 Tax=Plasmodium knowlesi TaxID=5850 RepID=A0A5K1VUW3_PLAKH|nr:nicotinamidase, putative [Plasmodium knowlesi strain H]OTN66037.1 putative Nicotinamidase [Plasmodium knowlesi]CAA9987846.1 nicotinamidase, putative [Plasmodium knowlesi strain H]SBO22327.1 nicotinamidase, putative [Plasmodium knowlesi strain H]SBO28778.1 nicotinamidase, putative [Plasmodium knowlesi strain H]VVS77320.1 nicotinamidase, putative [Plasmodium knowlesi strain H]|eukprot:XP_002258844.1 hypothetical protein, conserved in Plasmodium species [Plasmodium knowlesi strain H]
MKCFLIVDAQNDFLPTGSFNSRDDYMDTLNKINAIRLRLHNCTEKDLLKLSNCKHLMKYQPDKLLKENIVQYHQCNNDIDDDEREGDILIFPTDHRVMTCLSNRLSASNICSDLHKQTAQGTANGVERIPNNNNNGFSHTKEGTSHNGTHMHNHHPDESHQKNVETNDVETNNLARRNRSKESTNSENAKFALNILSVDYHPPCHISFAETHRILFEQIKRNKGTKNSSAEINIDRVTELSSHAQVNSSVASEEEAEGAHAEEAECDDEGTPSLDHTNEADGGEVQEPPQADLLQSAFLKKNKIFNLTDVMKNIQKIKSTRYIYKNVNSVSDIKEYSKLNFLNEWIDVWPIHCVRNTPGCKVHPNLIRHINDIVIKKADTENHDSHTIFENSEINQKILNLLKKQNIKSVYICGFIFEYCVKETALSFFNLGFDTYIVEDATAYLFGREEDKDNLKKKGIKFVNSSTMFA